jgi:hypothetical protein
MVSSRLRVRRCIGAVAVLPLLLLQAEPPSSRAVEQSLVVLFAVDQMRPDYLERFDRDFEGGFRWLIDHGTVYLHARQDHALTQTAPGQSTLLSGRPPASTGIISNSRGVPDRLAPLVGAPRAAGASPRTFRGSSLFDWMLAMDSATRVLSVSPKDRGAILPVGRARGDVYWYGYNGTFTTSTWYADTLPGWLKAWNARRGVGRLAGWSWKLLLPERRYPERDDYPFENGGRSVTFPHVLPRDSAALAGAIVDSPWMDSLTLDLALEGVRQLELGRRDRPDLLIVSLSATDAIGHKYGPDSREIHDHLVRLDRWLGRFLDSLNVMVPRQRSIFALSADHATPSIPEYVREVGKRTAGRYWDRTTVRRLRQEFESRWRASFDFSSEYGLLSADVGALAARGIDVDSLSEAIARELVSLPEIRMAYTPKTLAAAPASDKYAELWRRQLPKDHGWLVVTVLEPGLIWSSGSGTNHGTPEDADVEVPLIVVVPGHPPARHRHSVRVTALGPTLAALIGATPTEPVEAPLVEIVGTDR